MYIKSHSLEVPEKRSTLHIEPNDDLYSIVKSAMHISPPTAAVPATPPAVKEDLLPPRPAEEEGEVGCEDLPIPAISGSSVAGVMLCDDLQSPSPWSKEIKMKIHKDGLKSVDEVSSSSSATNTTTAASSSGPSSVTMSKGPSRIAGGSSVGGWGVDAGKQWKPIMLPPASAKKAAPSSSSGKSSTTNANSTTTHSNTNKKEKQVVVVEELSAIEMTKEEFMKAILSKMTNYHAIVQPNGDVNVHSGKVPKAKVVVESRQGHKVSLYRYSKFPRVVNNLKCYLLYCQHRW
jgi:hypothetical protein